MTFQIQGDDDLEVSGRLLNILQEWDVPEGAWDGLISYVYGDEPEHGIITNYYKLLQRFA